MRLTKLDLHGFKSFADHASLVFEPGVTAIVGPNGCGKSNVSDAVRWVLGEQRARALRGAKMEEVIFQGSSARRAVNVAEVALHFDNDEGLLPIAFREVVIARRLSRSGESEYLLNNSPCRLRDIHDLLRGTGLAADAGVVIESRMIDALLSDRPDDRRELFEEASGIGLYRDRRRSTERRLEETTVDLQRLDDLIAEVQSQVRSLARQRRRAERHAEIMQRRFAVELTLAAREMAAWQEELRRLDERLTTLRDAVPEAEASVRAAEEGRDAAHGARTTAEGRRAELARLVNQQREQLLQLQSEMAVSEERQRNAQARRERAEAERREGEAHGSRLSEETGEAGAVLEAAGAEVARSREVLERERDSEERVREAVSTRRGEVQRAEEAVREAHDRLRRAELDRERAAREADELAHRGAVLEGERARLADALALARREQESAAAEADEAATRVRETDATLAAARDTATAAREGEAAARAELFRADEQWTSLHGKVSALEALERERVGLAPAAARLLKERDQLPGGTIVGPLSDFITASQASATVVERFLGATLHAVLVRDRAAADAVRQWHSRTHPGPLLLLPLDAIPADVEADAVEAGALAGLVEIAEPARAWVRTLLGHVRAEEEGAAFVDARGAIWLPGSSGGPGPLRRRAELSDRRAELEAAEAARQAAGHRTDAMRAALEKAERVVVAATEAAAQAHREGRRAQELLEERRRRAERAGRELAEAEALIEKVGTRRAELAARDAVLEGEAAAAGAEIAERQERLDVARQALAAAEREQEDARERRTRAQVDEAQAQARLQVASDRARRLAQELSQASERLATLHEELSGLTEADVRLAEQMSGWRLEIAARQSALGDGEARLAEAERAVQRSDAALSEAEHELDARRRRHGALSDQRHHAEVRFTELSGRRGAIRERLETEWRRPLDDMLAALEPLQVDDDVLGAEREALRQQLETLGPVNPMAIEEHDEELKRLDFLTTQRADLTEARHALQQAIREIDTTARELFLATFTQVRENFRQIFMTLFGGGECDLRLENPEAPLDCDIEIHASPRGKRTQRIHLLSSGERALVALSLLFGIFLTKPSPFCLLDEVDAPLDDANIGRFVRMLNQFKTRTQFIVITHNPRTTTEAADAVYGVTMQEPGVSSLVSVRMRGSRPAADSPNGAEAEHGAAAEAVPASL